MLSTIAISTCLFINLKFEGISCINGVWVDGIFSNDFVNKLSFVTESTTNILIEYEGVGLKASRTSILPVVFHSNTIIINAKYLKLFSNCKLKESPFNMVPSHEQQAVVDAAMAGYNIVVDAVAGSGKTTTVLSVAKALPNKSILQITFNSQLKLEVREKVNNLNLQNIQVHTYHSIATTFYNPTFWNDGKLNQMLDQNHPPNKKKTYVPNIIIIDEAQDMTLLYFRVVQKFINDFCEEKVPQLIIMGDRYQSVYTFMQADVRFLTHAVEVWQRDFKYMTLCESYRVTKPIAHFINNCMVKQKRIISKKPGIKVDYYITNPFCHPFMNEIIVRIKNGSLIPEDIFILSASLKSANSPARVIENKLVEAGISVYVPIGDESRLDDDITRGKVVFATFPSSKGRERKIVIVLGFDNSYFNYYAKNDDPTMCPSALYVAVTRAKERLIVVGNSYMDYLPFLNMSCGLETFVTIYGKRKFEKPGKGFSQNKEKTTTPTEIIKFLKQDTIRALTPLIEKLFEIPQTETLAIQIQSKIKTHKNQYEDVSDINGIVIPIMWEQTGGATLYNNLLKYIESDKPKNVIKKAFEKIKYPCTTIADFLMLCNVYQSMSDGYIGRLAQIKKFDWITINDIEFCHKLLDDHVYKQDIIFEVPCEQSNGSVLINGRVDALTKDTLWEFKCVDVLTLEHLLQLVVYAWMFQSSTTKRKYKILNLKSGEIREMKQDFDIVNQIIDIIVEHKWAIPKTIDDKTFIDNLHSSSNL